MTAYISTPGEYLSLNNGQIELSIADAVQLQLALPAAIKVCRERMRNRLSREQEETAAKLAELETVLKPEPK